MNEENTDNNKTSANNTNNITVDEISNKIYGTKANNFTNNNNKFHNFKKDTRPINNEIDNSKELEDSRTLNIKENITPEEKFNNLRVAFLGGVREIGRNAYLYIYKDDMFLVDCGVMFGNPLVEGAKFYFPDFNFLVKHADKLRAIFITHSHEDHIGGIIRLFKMLNKIVPIYLGRFASKLLKLTLDDKEKNTPLFISLQKEIRIVKDGTIVRLNDDLSVHFLEIVHSTPDSFSLCIRAGNTKLFHTGDWKFDLTPISKQVNFASLINIASRGMDAIICDSTRCGVPGFSESEKTVADAFKELMTRYKNKRIIMTTFGSNVNRLVEVTKLAQAMNRKVFICGYSMVKNLTAAASSGMLNMKNVWMNNDKINNFKPEESFVICSGSQGELEGTLMKIAKGMHKYIKPTSNDVIVFSSDAIPGNEENVFECINHLMEKKSVVMHKILSPVKFKDLHVSGHGAQKDILLLLNFLRPKLFVPVHGEYHHMCANMENAVSYGMHKSNVVLSDNGKIVTFLPNGFFNEESFDFKPIILEKSMFEITEETILKRKKVLSSGVMYFNCVQQNKKYLIKDMEFILTAHQFKTERDLVKKINEALEKETGKEQLQFVVTSVLCSVFNCLEEELPFLFFDNRLDKNL